MASGTKFCRGSLSFSYNSLATSSDIFQMMRVGDSVWTKDPSCSRFILKDPHPLNLEGASGRRTPCPACRVVVAGAGPRRSPESGVRGAVWPQLPSPAVHRRTPTGSSTLSRSLRAAVMAFVGLFFKKSLTSASSLFIPLDLYVRAQQGILWNLANLNYFGFIHILEGTTFL